MVQCLNMLGEIAERKGDFRGAEGCFRRASEQADDAIGRCTSLESLAPGPDVGRFKRPFNSTNRPATTSLPLAIEKE